MKQTLFKLDFKLSAKIIKEIKAIPYFSMKGKIKSEWYMSYGDSWDAAWNAARNAARNAAWDAAGNAAWDARTYWYMKFALSLGAKIEAKHVKHIEDRMDVWRAGYGLLCDVNGKLYVYAKGKGASSPR